MKTAIAVWLAIAIALVWCERLTDRANPQSVPTSGESSLRAIIPIYHPPVVIHNAVFRWSTPGIQEGGVVAISPTALVLIDYVRPRLTVLNPANGALRWTRNVKLPAAAAVDGSRIYVVSGTSLVAFSDTGAVLWRRNACPTARPPRLYAGNRRVFVACAPSTDGTGTLRLISQTGSNLRSTGLSDFWSDAPSIEPGTEQTIWFTAVATGASMTFHRWLIDLNTLTIKLHMIDAQVAGHQNDTWYINENGIDANRVAYRPVNLYAYRGDDKRFIDTYRPDPKAWPGHQDDFEFISGKAAVRGKHVFAVVGGNLYRYDLQIEAHSQQPLKLMEDIVGDPIIGDRFAILAQRNGGKARIIRFEFSTTSAVQIVTANPAHAAVGPAGGLEQPRFATWADSQSAYLFEMSTGRVMRFKGCRAFLPTEPYTAGNIMVCAGRSVNRQPEKHLVFQV